MIASAAFYDPRAERLGARYAGVRFEDVHAGFVGHLPRPGAHVIDVGAGSGRDAYALAARGYRVTAVEPSRGMRAYALSGPGADTVRWIDDALPGLQKVRREDTRYEFVLCSAVLMHVSGRENLTASFESLADLATSGGAIAVSLRAPTASDPIEIFHEHSPRSVLAAARRAGLTLVDEGGGHDVLGRKGLDWRWWVFQTGLLPER